MNLNVPLRCSAPAGLPCADSAEVTIRLWLAPSGVLQEPPQAGEAGWGLRGLAGAGSHGPCLAGFVPCVPWVRAAGGRGDALGIMSLRRWSSCSGLQQGDIVPCPVRVPGSLVGTVLCGVPVRDRCWPPRSWQKGGRAESLVSVLQHLLKSCRRGKSLPAWQRLPLRKEESKMPVQG